MRPVTVKEVRDLLVSLPPEYDEQHLLAFVRNARPGGTVDYSRIHVDSYSVIWAALARELCHDAVVRLFSTPPSASRPCPPSPAAGT